MAVEVEITGFIKKVKGLFQDATNKKAMTALGKKSILILRRRTQLGKTFSRETFKSKLGEIKTRPVRLKPLSPNYVEFRKENSDYLHENTAPKKSNLTLTGQMLESLLIREIRNGKVKIGPSKRRRSRALDPTHAKDQLTNEQVAEMVAENGRKFLNFSEADASQLQRFYRKSFADILRKKRI